MSPEERKRRVRQHIDLSWSKGRLALAEHLQSRYFSYRSSFISQPVNSAGFGLIVREIRQAIPDLEVAVEECLSEGNRVVTSSTLFGTLEKSVFGLAPSGKILTVAAMSIWTLNPSGDIEEINPLFDLESARTQLGLASPIPITLPSTLSG